MTRYGHDLRFGSFVLPGSSRPDEAVRLAVHSERVGLDLVTFQDHPYQPALLDAWTLMSYVAARTDRIRIAPSVLNLPLRPPAVMARAATSLDLLSGGRIELGLGTGVFWDAIAAMGVAPLAPGEQVEAIDEAIDIIRGTWRADDRSRFVAGGAHHRVDGAKRGPAPAHDIELWLGAYKPRMQRLIGAKADGWLPGMAYLGSLSALTRGNAIIDEAAQAAGRSPSDVRRLLNLDGTIGGRSGFPSGDTGDWAEQLAALALTDGVSTFILSSDDDRAIERFAREIAPEVRRRVEAEARPT